jgi:hypothetical protein
VGLGHVPVEQVGRSCILNIPYNKCCGSMVFWCGSGSADPPLTGSGFGFGSWYFHH